MTKNPQSSDQTTSCTLVEDNIVVMLLAEARFRDFITGGVSDATSATEVLLCLSAESRQQVDETIGKAIAAGGKPCKPILEQGPMYGGSFQDLDGHVWESLCVDTPAEGP